jgi:uncharacterized iron-regulated membrane protein
MSNLFERMRRANPMTARVVVAVFGGYALGALASVAALALPIGTPQAVITGMLASFIVYAGTVIGVFLARRGRSARQSMAGLHTWAGLLAGWLLYAMFLTGTVSYFRDEISQWMRPEIGFRHNPPDAATAAARASATLGTIAEDSTQWWFMQLPTPRRNVVTALWLASSPKPGQPALETATFDPATGMKLAARDTLGGDFFYRFHYQFYYLPAHWGHWLAGLCAMFMLVAIVSGVITHKKIFVDFFTFRWGKGQRSWLDAHNALSVFGLPFYLMITYTGLVTLMTMYMPWGAQIALKTPSQQQAMDMQLSSFIEPVRRSGVKAALAPIDAMVRAGEARWGRDGVASVQVTNPGDATARVVITRGATARVSTSPQYLLFDGTNGTLLDVQDRVGAAAQTRGVLYALHMGRFADVSLRWLYFLVSLGGTAMVGTGLVMWTVKRRQKLPDPERPDFGFRLVERLNIASIVGLPIAMAGFLWSNRLLPTTLAGRPGVEVDAFFAVWAATLLYALARPAQRAWIELLWLATAMLALLPVLNALTTRRPLWRSVADGDWVYAGFDLTMWGLAALHGALAMRTSRRRPRARALHTRESTPSPRKESA